MRIILTWDYQKEVTGPIDVIYASPPCNLYFSPMRSGNRPWKEWEKQLSLQLVNKTIEIIKYYKPKHFIIENPRGKMIKHYPDLLGYKPQLVYYCMLGFDYQKPTHIWTDLQLKTNKCVHKKHDLNIRRFKRGQINDEQYRAMIPPLLALQVRDLILNE